MRWVVQRICRPAKVSLELEANEDVLAQWLLLAFEEVLEVFGRPFASWVPRLAHAVTRSCPSAAERGYGILD